jgi:hypothetical protein
MFFHSLSGLSFPLATFWKRLGCAGVLGLTPLLSHAHGAYHDVVATTTLKLRDQPNDPALHFTLACAHQEHGEWSSALVELEHVDRLASGKFTTDLVRGQALATGGHWETAHASLNLHLETHPRDPSGLRHRALVLLHLGQAESAITDFHAALTQSSAPTVELFLEAAEAHVRLGSPKEAATLLRRAVVIHPHDLALLTRSLEVELLIGDHDAALQLVGALQRQAPRPEPWMAKRASILAAAQRPEDARSAWTSLRDHLRALPSLERGTPLLSELFAQSQRALGIATPLSVIAPPTPIPPP